MVKCIFNGEITDQDKASVKLTDLALLRGYGIFDFFRLEGSVPLFIEDHLERFFNSAAVLRLPVPLSREKLKERIFEMLEANKLPDSGVRMVLTGGESPDGYQPGSPTLFVLNEVLTPVPDAHFKDGIKLISLEYQRSLPEVKSINYLVGISKIPDVKAAGATDLLFHSKGKVLELTRSNFFIVDEADKIITSDRNILKGINRKNLIKWAGKDFHIEERTLMLEELQTAREAFITGTTKKVMPVTKIDDLVIGRGFPGDITKQLQDLYQKKIQLFTASNSKIF